MLALLGNIGLGLLAILVFVLLWIVFSLLPSPSQLWLARNIKNKKTGKALSNNNYKFPLGDIGASVKDYVKGEGWRIKFTPEGACGWWALNNFDVQLISPEWLKDLLSQPESRFDRSLGDFTIFNGLLGVSVLNVAGNTWTRIHKVLIKAFSPANLLRFQPTFVEQTRNLIKELDLAIATGQSVDMNLLFNALTLDVMLDVGFGDQVDRADREKILHAFRYLLGETQNPIHDIPVFNKLPFGATAEVKRQFKILRETAAKIVRERRQVYHEGRARGVHEGKYIIDLMIEAHESEGDSPLTDLEVRDNTVALLLAGSETTGTSLTWALANFCAHPEYLADILEENAKSGLDWDSFAHVSNLDVELPVLTKNIHESLRLRPALSGIPQRIFREPGTVGDLDLPQGSRVGCALWLVHHNPEYWPQPDKFDPSRFDEDKVEARHPFSFLPFGRGRRQCLGKVFAMNEMRIVLSLILKHYSFTYDESKGPIELVWKAPTVVPKNALFMFPSRRDNVTA
eukprot:m.22421 g.22421  ORF g.22421 m.22421 type:complete len:513 (-) comp8294_c1_seq1:25-1563(-)